MLDRRYQVFVTTSCADMHDYCAVVVQTLMGMGFFAWGLESRTPLSSAYARRQIEDCDYVLLILGQSYGEQSVSGISFMHLEYIYAVTKQKPIIAFIFEQRQMPSSFEMQQDVTHDMRQHLADQKKYLNFKQQLHQELDQVFHYKNLKDLEQSIRANMPQMTQRYPSLGWVRPQNLQILQDEIDQLKIQLAEARLNIDRQHQDPFFHVPAVSIHDIFSFDYRMQAYQEREFKELICEKQMTWAALLHLLSLEFHHALPEADFSKVLNAYLSQHALEDAQKYLARAHTVAQVQINVRALQSIKQQMRRNEWLLPVGRDDRQRMLWRITQKGLKLLDELHLFGRYVSQMEE